MFAAFLALSTVWFSTTGINSARYNWFSAKLPVILLDFRYSKTKNIIIQ